MPLAGKQTAHPLTAGNRTMTLRSRYFDYRTACFACDMMMRKPSGGGNPSTAQALFICLTR